MITDDNRKQIRVRVDSALWDGLKERSSLTGKEESDTELFVRILRAYAEVQKLKEIDEDIFTAIHKAITLNWWWTNSEQAPAPTPRSPGGTESASIATSKPAEPDSAASVSTENWPAGAGTATKNKDEYAIDLGDADDEF